MLRCLLKGPPMSRDRKRYAIVGTGGRSRMFLDAIVKDFAGHAELVAFCDLSPHRMAMWNRYLSEGVGHGEVPAYTHDRFDDMVRETKPDTVIVTTMDATHHTYIVRAMELGCDAVSEKPMTTDEDKVSAIFGAIERTGKDLRVAFNYRWTPPWTLMHEVVNSGKIGRPTLVDFQWRLDTSHGADYFRRWHREKKHSGGLLVHKATHHFDLVNWILGDRPSTVYAQGGLEFYGEHNAKARGVQSDYRRYTDEPLAKEDPFALELIGDGNEDKSPNSRELYKEAEADSGYVRDRNVFGGEDKWPITAEDTMSVNARYAKGALLSYTLIAYSPWEGERMTITGTEGQVELFSRGKGHIIRGQSDEELAAEQYTGENYCVLQRQFGEREELVIPKAVGGHGGGDAKILERIFVPGLDPDPHHRDASHEDGAWSVLTGVAANQSIGTGMPVKLDDLAPASLVAMPTTV